MKIFSNKGEIGDGFLFPFARRGKMNKDNPGAAIKKGEPEILEFKEGFDKEAIETKEMQGRFPYSDMLTSIFLLTIISH